MMRKKRNVIFGVAAVLLTVLLGAVVLIGCVATPPEIPDDEKEEHEWQLSDQPEKIPEIKDDGIYAVFTVNSSVAGRINGTKTQKLGDGVTTTKVTAKPALGYRFVRWSDGVTEQERAGESFSETTVITAVFDYDCYDLPIVLLTTETGADVTSKTEYIDAGFSLVNADETYEMLDVAAHIRGRGNNTWTYDKKSYKIKFDSKTALLGVGKKAKTWILMANVCDQSLLRNQTALHMIQHFDGIDYEPNATSVEVYLNGEYRGVYLLAEETTLSKAHVNLDDSSVETEVDTGYLFELSYYAEDVAFTIHGKNYEIKSDLSSDPKIAEKQKKFLYDYAYAAWTALKSGDRDQVEEYIDLDSLVDAYLAEEIVKNLDMGWDSFYLHKDAGGKLCFGPIWDFDLSFGNGDETCQYVTELYCGIEYQAGPHLSNPWFYTAMKWRWFRELVTERFDKLYPTLEKMPEEVLETGERYLSSFERNFQKWKIFGQKMNRETEFITSLRTYEEHNRYLAAWIGDRLEWLKGFFHSEDYFNGEYRYVSANTELSKTAKTLASKLAEEKNALTTSVKSASVSKNPLAMPNEDNANLFDGNLSTKLCCQPDGTTATVQFQLKKSVTVVGYALVTGGDTSEFPERNPRAWSLFGSENGKEWHLIDQMTNGRDVLEGLDCEAYGFSVADAAKESYRYFKIVFDGDNLIQLSEIILYEEK